MAPIWSGSTPSRPSLAAAASSKNRSNPVARLFMRDKRSEIAELEARMNQMADLVDAFYERLGARHSVFNDWMDLKEIERILDETSTPDEAERRLIQLYQDDDGGDCHLLRPRGVAGIRERHHLLVRPCEDYDAGRFDTCTLLLISVMDGFVNDFGASRRKGLAARGADEMVAWDTVAGHQLGLTNALKPFLKSIKKRVDEEVFEVHRHGIVHGSVVNFNNVIVATKAWNLLFAVVDWSVATTKRTAEEDKPPPPTLRETIANIAEYGRRKRAREQFTPWTVGRESEGFDDDEVVVQTRLFIDAWQKEQSGLGSYRSYPRNSLGRSRRERLRSTPSPGLRCTRCLTSRSSALTTPSPAWLRPEAEPPLTTRHQTSGFDGFGTTKRGIWRSTMSMAAGVSQLSLHTHISLMRTANG